jgi:hypothetical protein
MMPAYYVSLHVTYDPPISPIEISVTTEYIGLSVYLMYKMKRGRLTKVSNRKNQAYAFVDMRKRAGPNPNSWDIGDVSFKNVSNGAR